MQKSNKDNTWKKLYLILFEYQNLMHQTKKMFLCAVKELRIVLH